MLASSDSDVAPEAMFLLSQRVDYHEGCRLLGEAAERGNADAQREFLKTFSLGHVRIPPWLSRPENAAAKFVAGLMIARGTGFERDLARARELWMECPVQEAREFPIVNQQFAVERLLFCLTKIEQRADDWEVYLATEIFCRGTLGCFREGLRVTDLPSLFLYLQEVFFGNRAFLDRLMENENEVVGLVAALMEMPDSLSDPMRKGKSFAQHCLHQLNRWYGESPVYGATIAAIRRRVGIVQPLLQAA
jgi:hypothetical protein